MKLVGYKSDNDIELANGQHIKIYDRREGNKLMIDGYLEYLPSAFMINNHDGSKYLLFWCIREQVFENDIPNREKYKIEVVE